MQIWTNGTITPEMAVVEAAKILRKHLNVFIHYFEIGDEIQDMPIDDIVVDEKSGITPELRQKLSMTIDELELSVRAHNCLEAEQLKTVGDIVTMTSAELLKVRNFGKRSLKEIEEKLADLALSLGMEIEWPVESHKETIAK